MQKLSVLFWLRKNKMNKIGRCPLYCRITLNGVRAKEFSTGHLVKVEDWSCELQMAKCDIINMHIQQLRNKINIIYIDRLNKQLETTADIIKDILTGKIEEQTTFIQLFKKYLAYKEQQIDQPEGIGFQTYKKYEQLLGNIIRYLDHKHSRCIIANCIKAEHLNELKIYLLNLGFKLSHTNKHLKFVKQVYKWGAVNELVNISPILNYTLKHEKLPPPIFLTKEELQKIELHKFASNRLQTVADCFLFQCYTGMSYMDIKQCCKENVTVINGIQFFCYSRIKTNEHAIIPMSCKLIRMLEKYNYNIPVLSNQKYNSYLKEVIDIVGIEKRITTHIGRKTFTNYMLNTVGFTIESVAKMLGHAKIQTTQEHYGRVSVDRLLKEIEELGEVA